MRVTAKTERKRTIVGLWVLAACAGRSTRSKGSQQTLRLSHPVRVARKPAKNDFSGFRAGDRAGWPRTCPEGAGAGNLAGSPPRTAPEGFGSLESARLGPQTPWGVPPRPSKLPKMFVLPLFGNIGGVAPVGPAQEAPGPWILPAWGPRRHTPLQKPKCVFLADWQGRPSDRHRRPRVPGFCQPGAPDPPGGYPPHPQKCQKCMFWPVFVAGSPLKPAQKAPGPWNLPAWGPDPPGGTPPDPPKKARCTQWSWVWGPSLLPNGKRSIAGLGHHSPRIPGGFTLPHRSDGTLGRGPRSEPRAPMQMVSGALGSLGFRV